jgi:hypothetical protein
MRHNKLLKHFLCKSQNIYLDIVPTIELIVPDLKLRSQIFALESKGNKN